MRASPHIRKKPSAAGSGIMRTRTFFLLWMVGSVFLSLCLTALTGFAEPIEVTDMGGRSVTVPGHPERIVCTGPGSLRQICYLGAQNRVVGVERMEKDWSTGRPYWIANPDLAALPSIGPGGPAGINAEPDLEALLKVRPDVIFISYMDAARAEALERKIGIPVVLLSMGRFATFDEAAYDSLRIAGRVLGQEARAEEIVAFIEEARKDLQRRTVSAEEGRKPGIYIGAIGYKGTQGIESTDADYAPLDWIHARNLAREVGRQGHFFLDREKLLAMDPEFIFLDGGGLDLIASDYERKRAYYQTLKAFREGKVYILFPYNWYVTNIGTALADAYAAGKILCPERFSDVDLNAKADEIFTFLLGRPVLDKMKEAYGDLGRVADFLSAD